MDNVCHSLVGAALAECGLRRRTRYATAALVIGANLPDVDVVAVFTGHALGFRRGITHGIPALIILPFLLTGLILAWERFVARGSRSAIPGELLKLSALAVLTHPTLDWMNTYGMRWLMPLNGTWFYGDSLFIVDPWLFAILGAAWIVGMADRRADGQAGSNSRHPSVEQFARRMVGLAALYIVAMMTLTAVGRAVVARDLGLQHPGPRDVMVAPRFLESWRRDVTVKTVDGYRFGYIEWLPRPALRLSADTLRPNLDLLAEVPRSAQLDALLDWARFPFVRRDAGSIHVDDARYARRGSSFGGVTIRKAE